MRLSEIKGEQAFKTIGSVVGCLREMFTDKKLIGIVQSKNEGWILDFFAVSLEEKSEIWMKMFLALNPDVKKEEVSISNVIRFAYEFKNDDELMTLFFSQGDQMVKTYSGSPTENTKETEKM